MYSYIFKYEKSIKFSITITNNASMVLPCAQIQIERQFYADIMFCATVLTQQINGDIFT